MTGGVPPPPLAINATGPVGLLRTVYVWENAPCPSETTVPSGMLVPPFNFCRSKVTLVCGGKKLLPVMVARCPTVKVAAEMESCGGVAASTVYELAGVTAVPMVAQTVYVAAGVASGQRNQPVKFPPAVLPACSTVAAV